MAEIVDKYELIKRECFKAKSTNPIEILTSIMKQDYINMHGAEHHILDGASLMTAMYNAGMKFDLAQALDELITRGKLMPGATCGKWGMCGSSASVGAVLSIINQTGPLSNDKGYRDNIILVSKALQKIAEIGGPRCCKRNAFLSITTAVDFVNEQYGLNLPKQESKCEFSNKNKQCIGTKCPFFDK